jgi:hypothetical protein
MGTNERENLHKLTISDGGLTERGVKRTHADVELERALRALFVAMRDRRGRSVGMGFRDVASGKTAPWRMLMRRLREAKAARNDAHNYPLMKRTVREIDRWVDRIHGRSGDTGDYPKVA